MKKMTPFNTPLTTEEINDAFANSTACGIDAQVGDRMNYWTADEEEFDVFVMKTYEHGEWFS